MQRLVQQPRHGPTTLRWQKAQEERCQSRPTGAAGQDPRHGRDERYEGKAPDELWSVLMDVISTCLLHHTLK